MRDPNSSPLRIRSTDYFFSIRYYIDHFVRNCYMRFYDFETRRPDYTHFEEAQRIAVTELQAQPDLVERIISYEKQSTISTGDLESACEVYTRLMLETLKMMTLNSVITDELLADVAGDIIELLAVNVKSKLFEQDYVSPDSILDSQDLTSLKING